MGYITPDLEAMGPRQAYLMFLSHYTIDPNHSIYKLLPWQGIQWIQLCAAPGSLASSLALKSASSQT